MLSAFAWGFLGGAALLIGAALAWWTPIPKRLLGAIMAFGAGVLVSAVAFDLVDEATKTTDGDWAVAAGLVAGAIVFFVGDALIDRRGGAGRKSSAPQEDANAKAILLGTVLDGVPESIVIGLGLVGGQPVSAAVVAAVFLSNLPEAIASTTGLKASGWSARGTFLMWAAVAFVAGVASLAGFALLESASSELVAFVMAFAGGALLTMLTDSMLPEAYELDGRTTGLLTTAGFGIAYAISAVA